MRQYAKIGFHTVSLNGPKSDEGNALANAYESKLGLSHEFSGWGATAGPRDIAYLTQGKAKELGVDVAVL